MSFDHQQRIAPDGSVLSVQTLAVPLQKVDQPSETAALAGQFYWTFLRQFGRGLLRITPDHDGRVDVSAPGMLLLSFLPPVIFPMGEGVAIRYPVGRGAAVHPRHRGQGHLQMGIEPERLSLEVAGYYPSLVGWPRALRIPIYEATQSAMHMRIARGYLTALARHLGRE